MLSESSSAASYKLIARAKSPWADLVSPSCISCERREAPMRSQPVKPRTKRTDSQIQTSRVVPDNGKIEHTGQILSGQDIVANVLTCDPARTSILFPYRNINFSSRSAFRRSHFHRGNLLARVCRH